MPLNKETKPNHLDYGIFIYRSVWKFYLKKLDPIHPKGLRLVLVAFRTSPGVSLYTETQEATLQLKCEKLALQYYTKLKSCSSNPAYDCIFNSKRKQQFEQTENKHQIIWPSGGAYSPRIRNFCYKCT